MYIKVHTPSASVSSICQWFDSLIDHKGSSSQLQHFLALFTTQGLKPRVNNTEKIPYTFKEKFKKIPRKSDTSRKKKQKSLKLQKTPKSRTPFEVLIYSSFKTGALYPCRIRNELWSKFSEIFLHDKSYFFGTFCFFYLIFEIFPTIPCLVQRKCRKNNEIAQKQTLLKKRHAGNTSSVKNGRS